MARHSALAATAALLALAHAPAALATVIAEQDFNALSDAGTFTTDQLPDGSALTNTGSQNIGGPGLDFTTRWFDTRGEGLGPRVGAENGDFIGVNSFIGADAPNVAPGGAPVASGVEHNFEFNDGDGLLVLGFEAVDVSSFANRFLTLDYWINDTGYEADDAFTVTLSDGGISALVLDFGETELEANASADNVTDNWNSLSVDLDALISGTGLDPTNLFLSIAVDTNAGAESIFVDNVLFEGQSAAVPEPAALALLGFGLAGFGLRRRRPQ